MNCRLLDLGEAGYDDAYGIQQELVCACRQGRAISTLMLLEHPSIFTIGRRGSLKNLLCDLDELKRNNVDVRYADRGGDITFHGKGQLVAYPIFDLREIGCDLHKFLRSLEKVIMETLKMYNLVPHTIDGFTGVWVNNKKISSLGIGVKGWISYHGVSLNVNPDLRYFSLINPCGLEGVKMTSMEELLERDISMDEVKSYIIRKFENIFNLEFLKGVDYDRGQTA